jgi:hypothetical protein
MTGFKKFFKSWRSTATPTDPAAPLWFDGMLIHGGEAIRNPDRTRRSYVCHYIPPGCDKSAEAQGPFNW